VLLCCTPHNFFVDILLYLWQGKIYFAGSVASLGAGLLFGSLLCYGAYQTSQNPNNYLLLLGTSVALGGLMGYRFYNSRKFMPAGLVTILR
jgi:uncharacterized membrane protein (UPF0136 family)